MKYSVLSEWTIDGNHGSNCKNFDTDLFGAKDYFLQERSKALRLNLEKVEEGEEDDIMTYDVKNSYHVHLNYIKEK